jgi:bifunctional UDP-N-acetylglucosamine pyrophosphorylase / glucosamine-1-phosphate N-acetyltransferase
MTEQLTAVVIAGGLGTRMKSATPKHLHPLLGRRMVDWVIAAANDAGADDVIVVASPETRDSFDGVRVAVQETPNGTGDAVRCARGEVDGGDVLVLSGDTPLLDGELLRDLVDTHRREGAAATVLSFEPPDVRAYGRVLRDGNGRVARIAEVSDASAEELAVREVNSSIYVFRADQLWPVLERLEPHNAQGELYLTDTIGLLTADGEFVAAHKAPDAVSTEGINTRAELAAAAAVLRARINEAHMLNGVTIVDPLSTWIDAGVELQPDVTIHPFTVLRGRTRIEGGAEIHSHVVAIDATVGPGATVGPFCYLRPGTVLAARSKAGTFVEIKNSHIGEETKVPHLSYIGDAEIGAGTNIGAGNVTANFDHRPGQPKKRTKIGRNVRTAVDNTFVAPVEIGDDAWTAAGSVITEDVPPGSLAGFPARQQTKEGWVYDHGDGDDDDD